MSGSAQSSGRGTRQRLAARLEADSEAPARSLYLVSCVKTKCPSAAPARDLYISAWFRKARAYVEQSGQPWRILSAKYGLVDPQARIAPYELTLNAMGVAQRRAWASKVLAELGPCLAGVETVVFLAGQKYREHLEPALRDQGLNVLVPMRGLRQGQQLSWLTGQSCD